MFNRKLHILLYTLLFIYILISLGQYYHFKNEINKKIKRIENLKTISLKNKKKIEQIKSINKSYEVLELYLDSISEKRIFFEKKGEKVKISKNILPALNTLDNDTLKLKENNLQKKKPTKVTDSSITSNNIIKNDKTENKNDQIEEESYIKDDFKRSYFFNEITNVYYNLKRPRPVNSKDKNIWIEIQSENSNYVNSIPNIIKQITLNNVNLSIIDIKESITKTPSKYISTYYIQVKIPKGVIYKKNILIVTADVDYSKLFEAYE